MYRKRHKRGKRLASVFLTVALITATVPVQAAEFGTPDSFEEIFSSGEEDSCITDTENNYMFRIGDFASMTGRIDVTTDYYATEIPKDTEFTLQYKY